MVVHIAERGHRLRSRRPPAIGAVYPLAEARKAFTAKFISHDHDEREVAAAWKDLLEQIGAGAIDVFLSSDVKGSGMRMGGDVRAVIRAQLRKANYVLALFTPQSGSNEWMLWECGVASGPRAQGKLVPVRHDMSLTDLPAPTQSPEVFDARVRDSVSALCSKLMAAAGHEVDDATWEAAFQLFQERIKAALATSKARARAAGRAPSCGRYMRYYHVHLRVRGTVEEFRSGDGLVSYIGSGLVDSRDDEVEFTDRIRGASRVKLAMYSGDGVSVVDDGDIAPTSEVQYKISGPPPLRINGEISARIRLDEQRRFVALHVPLEAVTVTFVVDMTACDVKPKDPKAFLRLESKEMKAIPEFRQLQDRFVWFVSARGVPINSDVILTWKEEEPASSQTTLPP